MRGVTPAHILLKEGVNCSLSTNNVLNPFTPFGDCSLIRMANLYANICQVGLRDDIVECYEMITSRSAELMRLTDYGVAVGKSADLVVIDCATRATAVAELVQPLWAFKRGRLTSSRTPPEARSTGSPEGPSWFARQIRSTGHGDSRYDTEGSTANVSRGISSAATSARLAGSIASTWGAWSAALIAHSSRATSGR